MYSDRTPAAISHLENWRDENLRFITLSVFRCNHRAIFAFFKILFSGGWVINMIIKARDQLSTVDQTCFIKFKGRNRKGL